MVSPVIVHDPIRIAAGASLQENQTQSVQLTIQESQLIENLIAEDRELQTLLRSRPDIHIANCEVKLGKQDAVALRDYLMDRFDIFGLGEGYQPTSDGKLLEDLIDKLFILVVAGE
jgi:hypothetical protein